jgi:hypothetical protein
MVSHLSAEFVLLILYGTLQILIGLISICQQWQLGRLTGKY